MDHDTEVSSAGAGEAPPTSAPSPGPRDAGSSGGEDGSAEGSSSRAETPATGTPGTGTRRRRRRGGRGRGGRGGGSTIDQATAGGSETTGNEQETGDAPGPDRGGARSGGRGGGGGNRSTAQRAGSGGSPGAAASGSPTEAATSGSPAETSDDGHHSEPTAGTGETAADGTTAPKRRRRRRGGRGRGRSGSGSGQTASGQTDSGQTDSGQTDSGQTDSGQTAGSDRRDAIPSERRRPQQPAADADDQPSLDDPPGSDRPASSRSRSRRRRRGGGGGARPDAQPSATPAKPATIEEQVAAGGPTRGLRSSRTRRDGRRRRREPMPTPPRITNKTMVITEHGERDQIAVLEDDVLVQHYVTRAGATSMVGNVYLGRVQNVLPGMEAAFVDVGRGRNGVLYAGEVNYSPEDLEGPAPRIEQVLKSGQAVIVQVTKDPMGGKGARLTANISLAGRYTVLAPDQELSGISRRLDDAERRRLKSILRAVKPDQHGLIVRTAAEGAAEDALVHDVKRLLATWDEIQRKAKKAKAPAVLYEEPELTVRVVRDMFTDEEFRGLVTDSPRIHERVAGYVRDVAPDLMDKVTLHEGPLSAFEEHRVVEQIHKALDRKVWLPSGGYLIIERTEAMTIIDVNTGKAVGKTNLEETVVNTNLEAAREAARQLRLRDIGGIIVIDFIDMLLEQNKKQVEDAMREALALDKTRSQVFEIGPLGLMQVTRKRVSSGLVESFSETCPHCEGRGFHLTYDVN